jgi:hypothetical protein
MNGIALLSADLAFKERDFSYKLFPTGYFTFSQLS